MNQKDLDLLKEMCAVQAPSGSEVHMRDYLIQHVKKEMSGWKVQPELIYGEDFQDCLILVFGKPRTAIYAHLDSVGYSISYENQLLRIGGPQAPDGTILIGSDSKGPIEGILRLEESEEKGKSMRLETDRLIDRGTPLVYQQAFKVENDCVQSCYLDNRLGIWNALKVAETLENGALVFSAWEEVGGGAVGYLADYLYRNYQIRQNLISDITWITEGVKMGEGVAVSLRDSGIPRKAYTDRIVALAKESGLPFQLEVESAGGSDGNALQRSPYPMDWCFIGAGEENVHQANERVHLKDIEAMHNLYAYLMEHL